MTVQEIYERVNLKTPIGQRDFFCFLNDTISELSALYNDLTVGDTQVSTISGLSDSIAVEPLYHTAIVDNILFLAGVGDTCKSEFLRKSENAHKQIWNQKAKGLRTKRNGW